MSSKGTALRAATLLVAFAPLLACARSAPVAQQRTAVKVATVTRADTRTGNRYSAHIEPAVRVDLAFKVAGYVESTARQQGVDGKGRALQEGDTVREGQALATLRVTDYALRAQEARSAREQAKTAFDQAQRDVDRLEKLTASGSVSKVELEGATTRLDGARGALAGAKTRVDEAAALVSDATLRSPLTGVVLKRHIEVGSLAGAGTLAFTLADVSSVKAVFAVPDSVLPRLRLGARQSVVTEAFPGVTFSGRISRISPAADPRSLVFEAEVLLPNEDGRLKPGSVAALSVEGADTPAGAGDAREGPPLVPLSAIVRAPGSAKGFAVFVVDEVAGQPTAHLREIELGEYLGRVIPVKKGLGAGERIVVLGAGLLSNNEAVELIP
jgi:multidrug efflux system membrane fusion protein